MKQVSDKHFRCTVCQRGFTRIDHLKRHHLRHSGIKPYACVFCHESFARCDNLRDHYPDCPQRGDRQIPETGQRGRRRHACESCTSMKLRCDGESPCSSCVKRNLTCNNERKSSTGLSGPVEYPPSTTVKTEDFNESSDRGSIQFLLNGGTDSFTEKFLLPPRSDRTRGMVYHTQREIEEATSPIMSYPLEGSPVEINPEFVDPMSDELTFFQDNFMSFINGPFAETQKAFQDPFAGGLAAPMLIPGQDPNLGVVGDGSYYEPESAFATPLVQSILAKSWTLNLDAKSQQEISTNLHFLLTTQRIRKFIGLYFRYWHPNCPFIHLQTFDLEQTPAPLLASMVFMGAMYSNDERELYVARRMLDIAELYVFSTEAFSSENEVSRVFIGRPVIETGRKDWSHFQHFQAGYLMLVVQYWAGTKVSRNRAMEIRFGEIIRVARSMNLTKCRHLPEDRIHERLWIQKESRIRTMDIICLLDCAFSFYQNYPCRLTAAEMECDLPCEDSIFESEHPFARPNFRFNRNRTVGDAFQSLFAENQQTGKSDRAHINDIDFTVCDMFILIHLLYAFINSHITVLIPLMRGRQSQQQLSESASPNDSDPGDPSYHITPEDSILTDIRTALARWRSLWMALRSRTPSHEWASMGFFKNGYNFWLVAQLLITKKHSVDVTMQMEVKCEDKLEKLKVLLQDDNV